MPTQPDHRCSAAAAAAAALHAASFVHTDGKQAAAEAVCSRGIMPSGSAAADTCNLWGHTQQPGSLTVQQQVVFHQTPQEPAPLNQHQTCNKPVALKQQHTPCQPAPPKQQPTASLAAGLDCAHEFDDALQVQKLNVTPHKPPRQLSGNPFAEPPQGRLLTDHVTAQAQHAQHAPVLDHAAGLTHHAEPIAAASGGARPLTRSQHPAAPVVEHQLDAACMSAAVATSGQATASSRQAGDAQRPSEAAEPAEPREVLVPSKAAGNLPVQSTMDDSPVPAAADQTSRLLLSDLEIEAMAADAEACLLEMQV